MTEATRKGEALVLTVALTVALTMAPNHYSN